MKINKFLILALVAFLLVQTSCNNSKKAGSSISVAFSAEAQKQISQKMMEYIDGEKLAGISTMVVKNGEIIHRENFGFADMENNIPIKNNTIYRIYSMTKPITAVALMTLFDEGKFKLDDKVSKYIPEFKGTKVYNPKTKNLEKQKNELTIRHLLTHTSGITYGWDQYSYVDSLYRAVGKNSNEGTIGEKVKIIAGLPLKYQPGTKWEYGLSTDVAGYLIEVLSGIPLDEFFKTRIFEPLKMDDTGFYVPEEKHDRFSAVYYFRNGDLTQNTGGMIKAFKTPVIMFSGGGGLVSTMDDYLKFCTMILNGGEMGGIRILKKSTVNRVITNQLPEGVIYGKDMGYGLAGSVNLETGVYGWAGAASTKFWIDKENKMLVLAFAQLMPSNNEYANNLNKIVRSSLMK